MRVLWKIYGRGEKKCPWCLLKTARPCWRELCHCRLALLGGNCFQAPPGPWLAFFPFLETPAPALPPPTDRPLAVTSPSAQSRPAGCPHAHLLLQSFRRSRLPRALAPSQARPSPGLSPPRLRPAPASILPSALARLPSLLQSPPGRFKKRKARPPLCAASPSFPAHPGEHSLLMKPQSPRFPWTFLSTASWNFSLKQQRLQPPGQFPFRLHDPASLPAGPFSSLHRAAGGARAASALWARLSFAPQTRSPNPTPVSSRSCLLPPRASLEPLLRIRSTVQASLPAAQILLPTLRFPPGSCCSRWLTGKLGLISISLGNSGMPGTPPALGLPTLCRWHNWKFRVFNCVTV